MGILVLSTLLIFSSILFSLSLRFLSPIVASLLRIHLTWASFVFPLSKTTYRSETKGTTELTSCSMGDQHKWNNNISRPGEKVLCVVCLCFMEGGEEMKELRCQHLFHKDCLDRWLALHRHPTCPLCRRPLRVAEEREQVLFFSFSSFQTASEHNKWWLR